MSEEKLSKKFKKNKLYKKAELVDKSFTASNKSYQTVKGSKIRTFDLGFKSQFYSPGEIFSKAMGKINEEALHQHEAMKSLKEIKVTDEIQKKHVAEPMTMRTRIALFIRKNKINNKFLKSMLRRRKWTVDQESKILEILTEEYNFA